MTKNKLTLIHRLVADKSSEKIMRTISRKPSAKIIRALVKKNGLSSTMIARITKIEPSNVSHNLGILRRAGIIKTKRDRRNRFHFLKI